jgi:hypothetical protein
VICFLVVKFWLGYQLKSLGYSLLGLAVVPYLLARKLYAPEPSRLAIFPDRTVIAFTPDWAWPWINWEDGQFGPYTGFWGALYWSAIRNSANGMRILPGACFLTEKAQIVVRKRGPFTIVTHGDYWCVYLGSFRFGWNIDPDAGDGWRCWPVIA